ncbi:MAG: hypothetical protein ACOYIA_05935 [Eubacteriales bacterium]|jgi:hypothetical protein
MEKTNVTTLTAELAGTIYKNMKTGADSVLNLLSKAEDDRLKSHMTGLLDGYENFASEAKKILDSEGVAPKEDNIIEKMGAKMGRGMRTLTDSSTSRLGEVLMEDATTSFCEALRLLHQYENKDCRPEVLQLVRDIIAFEENNYNTAKSFI